MGYLILEILVYLLIAAAIGFSLGWSYRDMTLKKFTNDSAEVESSISERVEVQETQEVKKEEKAEEPKEEEFVMSDKDAPELFTEVPESGQDKLSTIRGIGPVIEKQLNELGVYQFEQIASWTSEQELWISSKIAFPKRVMREEWVKQAQELVKNRG
jgi:predicted flap endonuclease-1-like 5' DNA nuclease